MRIRVLMVILLVIFSYSTSAQIKDSISTIYHIKNNDLASVQVSSDIDKVAMKYLAGSATGILSRLAGVSFTGGSMVSFRGLNPRYSNITIDGLAAPITEQNIKAFALALLPESTVQSIAILKSGSYQNQGEWGGAVVNIYSDADVVENFNKVSFELAYQHNFTFSDFYKDVDHGSTGGDFFGYGVNRRDFQTQIANVETLQGMSRSESAQEGAKLKNNWALETTSALPSFNIAYQLGRILYQQGDKKLSTITSFKFSRNQGGIHANRARYTGYTFNAQSEVVSSTLSDYSIDGKFSIKADVRVSSAWNYKINSKNKLNLLLMYSHTGENSTLSKYFVGVNQNKEGFFAQYGLNAQGIGLGRLSGTHSLGAKSSLNWSLGYSYATNNQPDLRRAAAQRNLDDPSAPFLLVIPESSKADVGARFGSKMADNAVAARMDFGHDFISDVFELRAGALWEYNNRDFNARLITNAKDDFTRPDLRFVEAQYLGDVFSPENFSPDGYFLVDGTTAFESYLANNNLFSGYLGIENAFGESENWESSLGIRIENFNQSLEFAGESIESDKTSYLPYAGIKFAITQSTVLKLGYSMSVNRPSFRELAPFQFYDFDYRATIQGNTELQNASIQNLDLSLLYTFGKNEYLSLSPFYKKINNPIEMIYIIRSDNPLFTFDNAKGASLGGIELELSKILFNESLFSRSSLLLNGNFSYTASEIALGESSNEVSANRPLQGQIPLLASLGASFISYKKNAQLTLGYKYMGKSLFSVGDGVNTFPWYNAPTGFLNAGFAYSFKSGLNLKLTAANLLNTKISQYEDANYNGSIKDEVDQRVQQVLKYQSYSVGVSYKF